MTKASAKNYWISRKAKNANRLEIYFLGALIAAGLMSLVRLAEWWFREIHVGNIFLFLLLSAVFWYGMIRIVLIWINYLGIKKPEAKPAPQGLHVAIFTTSSPGEPLSMIPGSGRRQINTAQSGWNLWVCLEPKPEKSIKHFL
jgi:cellulose synthase (UDP-forming)